MIGIFDSGLGGLTVLRRLRERLPQADILFFSDQAHVPYGERSISELSVLLRQNIGFLNDRGAGAIVMACNTSCAVASQVGWPASAAPIIDLIDSAAIAAERGHFRRIGVVATTATTRARAYTKRIRERIQDVEVFEVAAPALVPLVEAGILDGEEPRAAVAAVCAALPANLDAVILACTHYPLLDAHFAAALGGGVARLDPAIVQAERAAELAAGAPFAEGSGALECITSGDPEAFRKAVEATIGSLTR